MAAAAAAMEEKGYVVTGSDQNIYPPTSTFLEERKIRVFQGYSDLNLKHRPDLVVIGNALSRGNPEVEAVLEARLPYCSLPELIKHYFLPGKRSLVVAGTHGKTTSSSLLAWVFEKSGRNPSFLIGGIPHNFKCGARFTDSEWFIIEGDEYDTAFFDKGPKFLHYQPYAAILTSIEFDHADIFRDLDHIKEAFRKFMKIIDPKGFLLVEFSDKNTKDVINKAQCEVETYGFSEQADWQVADYKFEDGHGQFTLNHHGKEVGRFRLPMIGRHNILNSAAVTALALKCGLSADAVAKGLKAFKGIKRRQEVVGEKNGVTVIDDFAHNPDKILATLATLHAFPGRLLVMFQPHGFGPLRLMKDAFIDCFTHGLEEDDILLMPEPVYFGGTVERTITSQDIVRDVEARGREAYALADRNACGAKLLELARPGHRIVGLGARADPLSEFAAQLLSSRLGFEVAGAGDQDFAN